MRPISRYAPLRTLFEEQGKSIRHSLQARWELETGLSNRSFYNRLDAPDLSDYLLFSIVLAVPLEELLGRKPFELPQGEPHLLELAASLNLKKSPIRQ
ncbi:hypothetical protein [Fibrella forsythiae]|uniref:Uncharacterized protein n=1 Tax=Fibrella forsythiae TaxID=2817061 RepID=A0ABS3JP22_9BACT|nr:hypothetical protein [Fibrella forsythiae]MBO0951166.1 hypothetical protein [Fibrella forsythiae]